MFEQRTSAGSQPSHPTHHSCCMSSVEITLSTLPLHFYFFSNLQVSGHTFVVCIDCVTVCRCGRTGSMVGKIITQRDRAALEIALEDI